MGAYIEINVVIEAGSVAQGTVPDNVVVAGNLAKIFLIYMEDFQNLMIKWIQISIYSTKLKYS